jgi:hypothetical protein
MHSPPTVTVAGAVKLDGSPLETGTILFEPRDGATRPAQTTIEAGQYSLEVEPGPKIVRINSQKVVGQEAVYPGDPESPQIDKLEEQVPAQFNSQTTLEQDISAAADDVNFDLTSN